MMNIRKIIIAFIFGLAVFGLMLNPVSAETNKKGFWNDSKLPLGMVNNPYNFNSSSHTMTDSNGLKFKKADEGYITVNDDRYLAFALTGTVNGTDYKYTSMDFQWTWHVNETDDGHIIYAKNHNKNFIWYQYYYFYKDPWKPMKIEHYLKNNWKDISNTQMYYLMNALENDTVEYNETAYNVSNHMGLHKQGNFNDLISKINFNSEFDFDFDDIINDGFAINEFYIGNGSVINKPNINITAIGFTKNGGNFPKGASVLIDPTFSTDDVESISICPLDGNTIVVAWADETNDDRTFAIYDTNGTLKVGPVDVDDNAGSSAGTSISCSAFNSTHFVIGWYDRADYDTSFAIYDNLGNNLTDIIDADTDVGAFSYSVSVSAFNSSSFVISWHDFTDDDVSFRIYDSSGSPQTEIIDADDYVGYYGGRGSVSALNSTSFVIGWQDGAGNASFRIYDSSGNNLTNTIAADEIIAYSYSVSVSAFNSTHFVIGWYDHFVIDYDASFRVYDSNGNAITEIIDADEDVGSGSFSVSVSALNNTHFVIGWFDDADDDASFRIYDSNGNAQTEIIDAGTTAFIWQDVSSYEAATDIGIANDNFVMGWVHNSSLAVWGLYSGINGSVITLSGRPITPVINSNYTYLADNTIDMTPAYGETIKINTYITDPDNNIEGVYFTLLSPNGTYIINNINGTVYNTDYWNSTNYTIDAYGDWLVNITVNDTDGLSDSQQWNFTVSLGTLTKDVSTKTYSKKAGETESFNVTFSHTGNSNNTINMTLFDDMADSINFTFVYFNAETGSSLTNFTVTEGNNYILGINVTSNATLASDTYTGDLTFERINDNNKQNISFTVTISGLAGNVILTPVSWSISMDSESSTSQIFKIENDGDYNLTNCNGSIIGWSSYDTYNISDFTVLTNNYTYMLLTVSKLPAATYSKSLVVECIATANNGLDSDSASISATISQYTDPPAGGGGGAAELPESECGNGICEWDETWNISDTSLIYCPQDCIGFAPNITFKFDISPKSYSLLVTNWGATHDKTFKIENYNPEPYIMDVMVVCTNSDPSCLWTELYTETQMGAKIIQVEVPAGNIDTPGVTLVNMVIRFPNEPPIGYEDVDEYQFTIQVSNSTYAWQGAMPVRMSFQFGAVSWTFLWIMDIGTGFVDSFGYKIFDFAEGRDILWQDGLYMWHIYIVIFILAFIYFIYAIAKYSKKFRNGKKYYDVDLSKVKLG